MSVLKVMVDPGTPASFKVRATDSALDQSARAIELEDRGGEFTRT